jgi:hypothetical protein
MIEIEEGLRLRFPGRNADFAEGVEVGAAAVAMARGIRTFTRCVARGSIEQIREVATRLGYRVVERDADEGRVELMFMSSAVRPSLRLVETA